jgi:hypothetical protein
VVALATSKVTLVYSSSIMLGGREGWDHTSPWGQMASLAATIATIVMEMEELADEEPYAWTRAPILPCGPVLSSPVNLVAQKYRGPRVCHHKERFSRVEESAVDQVGR